MSDAALLIPLDPSLTPSQALAKVDGAGHDALARGEIEAWEAYDVLVCATTWLANARPELSDEWLCGLARAMSERLWDHWPSRVLMAGAIIEVAPERVARLIRAAAEISENAVYEALSTALTGRTWADTERFFELCEDWCGGGRDVGAGAGGRTHRATVTQTADGVPLTRPMNVAEWQQHARALLDLPHVDDLPPAPIAQIMRPDPTPSIGTTSASSHAWTGRMMTIDVPAFARPTPTATDHMLITVPPDLLAELIAHYAAAGGVLCLEPAIVESEYRGQCAGAALRIGAALDGRIRSVAAVATFAPWQASVSNVDAESALRRFATAHRVAVPLTMRSFPARVDCEAMTISAPAVNPLRTADTPEELLGIPWCPHSRADFVIRPNPTVMDHGLIDTAILCCPDCAGRAFVALPLHQVFPQRIEDPERYLRYENARARLRGEDPVESIEALIARDGRRSRFPVDYLPDTTGAPAQPDAAETFFA